LEVLKMNITELINELKKQDPQLTSYDLLELVKKDEKILYLLCYAAMKTYEDIEHIKKFI
jgi:hypothetical protein